MELLNFCVIFGFLLSSALYYHSVHYEYECIIDNKIAAAKDKKDKDIIWNIKMN